MKNGHLQVTGYDTQLRKQYIYHPLWIALRSRIRFTFNGKKGIKHDISIRNRKLAKIVRRCKEIPGEELFQYFDENDEARAISSGDVNDYIREIAGEDFTSKDFRTWEGSVEYIKVFKETGFGGSKSRLKKNIVSAIDQVAESLGNTRSICKKYYIHPLIFTAYENGQLENYVKQIQKGDKWMEIEERILMKLLK